MTKDFKQQIAADNSFGQYGLSWMLGGIGIGLLVGLGMYAIANKGDTTTTATHTATPPAVAASTNPAATPVNPNASNRDVNAKPDDMQNPPGFSYHAVLPQLEVGVPISIPETAPPNTVTAKDPKKTETPTPTKVTDNKADATPAKAATTLTSALPTGFNGLQIGSYKTEDQAAAMQERVKHSGLHTQMVKANVHGETWFRVRVGPTSDAATLNKWQQTLSGMGISALAVRM
ncbi:MAG: hypothetical protein RI964_2575 [Pseudomonadota bacterium]|jgi:cell division protein FtsN